MTGRPKSGHATKIISFRVKERFFHDHLRNLPDRTAFIREGLRMRVHADTISQRLNTIYQLIQVCLEEGELDEYSRQYLRQCVSILDHIGTMGL
jgi:hypothetical protein